MILKSKDKIVRKLALRVLAEALARQVAIISDGAAQADIEALMAPVVLPRLSVTALPAC